MHWIYGQHIKVTQQIVGPIVENEYELMTK